MVPWYVLHAPCQKHSRNKSASFRFKGFHQINRKRLQAGLSGRQLLGILFDRDLDEQTVDTREAMQDLPSGMVTFLFTDIEGSTRLWEQFPVAMLDAHARHDLILREAITANDGMVFGTVGDAFHAVFVSPLSALAGALAAQRALLAEPWGAIGALRVRMALHTSVVEPRDGDYFGSALSRVARLLDMGHGGQTLLSRAMQEAVRDQVSADVRLRDLGEHRLRDLVEQEHVFQVVVSDLPVDFPPLRKTVRLPSDLPAPPAAQLSSEQQLELDTQALRQAKLPGMPGIDFEAVWKKEREQASQRRARKRKKEKPDGML
jgi:class 3 adenylate cyclase